MDSQKSVGESSSNYLLSDVPLRRLKSVSNLTRGSILLSKRASNIHPSTLNSSKSTTKVLVHDILTTSTGSRGPMIHFNTLLQQLVKNQCEIHMFSTHRELLKFSYKPRHLYGIIINQELKQECESFVRNERSSGCQFTFMTFCLVSTLEQFRDLDKKRKNKDEGLHIFSPEDQQYSQKIVQLLFSSPLSETKIETVDSKWSVSQFMPAKNEKKGQIHIICQQYFSQLLDNRKQNTNIKVSSFKTFQNVMVILNQQKKQSSLEYNYYASMKDFNSQFQTSMQDESTKSYYPRTQTFINNTSSFFRGSKLRGVNLREKTVIICRRFHGEIKKIRALVNNERKILLWEISDEASGILQKMQEYFGIQKPEEIQEERLELQSYRSYYCEQPKEEKKQLKIKIEPIKIHIDNVRSTLRNIQSFKSKPLKDNFVCNPPLKPLPLQKKRQYVPVNFIYSSVDTKIPSLLFTELPFLQPDEQVPLLNQSILKDIKYEVKGHLILEASIQDDRPQFCQDSAWTDDFYQFEPVQLPFLRPIPEEMSSLLCKSNVFLQKQLYMKEFKHFSEESRSKPLFFCDWPQIFYQSELSLSSKLQGQEEHSVILYSEANEKWISNLKLKYGDKFTWFCLQDENWIDFEGNLNTETNVVKLSNKIKLFASSFDNNILDICESVQLFRVSNDGQSWASLMKIDEAAERELPQQSQEKVVKYYLENPLKFIIFFIEFNKSFPSQFCDLESESKGRLKLIYVQSQYVDSEEKLFIRYSEVGPVVKYVTKVGNQGRKNYVIYHLEHGKTQATNLIQTEKIEKAEEKQYVSLRPDIEKIFSSIKGLFNKLYIVCFEDQKKEIERLFMNYNINDREPESVLFFSLLHRDWSPTNSLKSKKGSDSLKKEEEVEAESGSHAQPQDSVGRGSLPIESRDHEQAPANECSKMVRVDDYQKIYIVYQSHATAEEKRGLLAACTKNQKIIPVVYNSVSELKELRGENTLMLLLMKEVPMQLFNELIEDEQLSIMFKNCNMKAVLPKNTNINLNSILDLFQHESVTSIKKLPSEQVTQYLSKFESQVLQINSLKEVKTESQLPSVTSKNDSSNLSQRTNFTSVVQEVRWNQFEFQKLKKSLNKNLVVLLVDFNKRNKFTILSVKHHLIIQSYSGESNLETEIRKKIGRHVILCVVQKNMLNKTIPLKKKYANLFLFLQINKYSEEPDEEEREFLAGEFGRSSDFEKFLLKMTGQDSKSQSNPESGESVLKLNKKSTLRQCLSSGRLDSKQLKSKDESVVDDSSHSITLSRVKSSKIRSPHLKKSHPFEESEYYQR